MVTGWILASHWIEEVFLVRSEADMPEQRDGSEKGVIFSNFEPFEWYSNGKMEELTLKHSCTEHHVGTGKGIMIPRGVPHCVHSFLALLP